MDTIKFLIVSEETSNFIIDLLEKKPRTIHEINEKYFEIHGIYIQDNYCGEYTEDYISDTDLFEYDLKHCMVKLR
mgnify:CR=1 FL=1